MIPLCTTANLPYVDKKGCAFKSVATPCVAQRVWPMPKHPVGLLCSIAFSKLASRPARFTIERLAPVCRATPLLSYPRYSNALSPFNSTGTACLCPTYPIMPHMRLTPFKRMVLYERAPPFCTPKKAVISLSCILLGCYLAAGRRTHPFPRAEYNEIWKI